MKSVRSRWRQGLAAFARREVCEPRAQHSEAGGASTSGRSFESCQKSQHLHSDAHPTNKFPWGILAAGSCVSTGIGWTWGHFGNQALFPDAASHVGWNFIPKSIPGPLDWLEAKQRPSGKGNNFLADAAAKAMPAVVNIHHNVSPSNLDPAERTCGSGFLVDSSGVIVTNAHVVESALQRFEQERHKHKGLPLKVLLQDGKSYEGEVLSLDRVSDLALVKINAGYELPSVKLGCSRDMRVGEWVLALGSPLTLQNSVTAGIVSCIGRQASELGMTDRAMQYIQTDAAINNGNSGGPLINLAGEVVGISCMKALFSSGVSFAIPIDSAQEIVRQMRADGRVVRPHVGVKMLQLTAENAAQMHAKDRKFPAGVQGVLLASVQPGSPAEKAGLHQGDIITGVGGQKAEATVPLLIEALKQSIGQPLKLEVQRGSASLRLSVTAVEARNHYIEGV